jgi:hypothetical protein
MQIEVIVWHHKRRTVTPPYSASAYLVDLSLPEARQVIAAGSCDAADGELVAAREALRNLQNRLTLPEYRALVDGALVDPERVIRERR